MFRIGSPARFVLVFAALVGLTVSSTHTAPMAQATVPTFTAATNYSLGTSTAPEFNFMALGDLNGDGFADAVVSNGEQPSQLRILFNNGSGGFGSATVLPISGGLCPAQNPYTEPTCATNVWRVEIADFNADGRNDIVAVNNHSRNITVLLGTGGGVFAAPVNYALGDSGRALAVGDINNDGYPDIVAGSANFVVRPFINNGDGTFTVGVDAGSPLGLAGGGINRQGMAIADFTGDGNADIAVGNRDSDNVLVLSGNGAGGFAFSALLPGAKGATVKAIDVNNDGKLDIVASQAGPNLDNLAIYINTSINNIGTFAAPVYVPSGGSDTRFFDAADINLDGNVDIVSAQNGARTLTLLLGDGAGGFTSAGTLAMSQVPGEPRIADLNNDGKLDIAVTNRGDKALTRFLNTTPALCAAGTYSATGNTPCTSADPGFIVPTSGATAQSACPVGTYSSVTGATACVPAPVGSYVDTVAATGSLLCPAGSFSATVGSASCTLASSGYYVPTIGASSQTACAAGFTSQAGATECTELLIYTSGSHVQTWDPILPASADPNWPSTVCTATPAIGPDANWINPKNAFSFGTSAHVWQPGAGFTAEWINAWSNLNSAGSGGPGGHNWTKYTTEVSGNGNFVLNLLADNCSWVYLDGTLVGFQGTTTQSRTYPVTLDGTHELEFVIFDGGGLAGGMFRLETNVSTTFPDSDNDGLTNVEEVLYGTDPNNPDTDGDGVSDGDEVANGTNPLVADQDTCSAGTFSTTGRVPCMLATPGYFVADDGATTQTACSIGTYSSGTGTTACTPAPAGSYVNTGAATEALLCPAGSFSGAEGAIACEQAPAGSYVDTTGAEAPTACAEGSFSGGTGATSCTLAPAGSYVDTTAATGPQLCPAGSYSSAEGAVSCTPAGAGFFVPTPGSTSQTACAIGYGSDGGASQCYLIDTDGDGVGDHWDAFPNSNLSPLVSVGTCSTGVTNQLLPNGATFNDLIGAAQAASGGNHGKWVSAVTALSNGWKSAGLITGQEHGKIVSCVARQNGRGGR